MPTEDREFFDPMGGGPGLSWEQAPAYPEGEAQELVIYEDEDGSQTRFLRLEPGVETDEVLAHEFYEEVFIVEGEITDTRLDRTFTAGMYACRTPGMEHGPYASPNGALTLEFRYYR